MLTLRFLKVSGWDDVHKQSIRRQIANKASDWTERCYRTS